MKKILLLLSGLVAIPLFTSCADYGVYGTTVARPIVANPGFVGGGFVNGGLAPLQVGFVATTFDRWAWDPYRRFWFDRSCGRYWDYRQSRYCTVVPRRYPTAVYPSGYRRGARLACPSYLPRTQVVASRGSQFGNHGRGVVNYGNDRSRFNPVVHGSSRGSSYLGNRSSSGRVYSSPMINGRTVTPSTVSRDSRLRTVSSSPTVYRNTAGSGSVSPSIYSNRSGSTSSRGSFSGNTRSSSGSSRYTPPTVRSSSIPTVRSSGDSGGSSGRSPSIGRSAPTVSPSGYSRGTSGSSRSMNTARQRTR